VRLLLEPIGASSAALAPVAVMPGESIDWEGIHLRHLGW
jgi:hypothetical protein